VTSVHPLTPDGLVEALAVRADELDGVRRVCIDGAPAADPHGLASRVVASLASRRPAVHVRADHFWRPSGQRLEYGKHDVQAYLDTWLDVDALRREVLDSVETRGTVLAGLRDPLTDRSLRLAPVELGDDPVVVVSGSTLLGRGLAFELTVHLRMSPAALVRRTPESEAWMLEAIAQYAADVQPESHADLVVRCDDPAHPALVVP
jgi:hypothetical protein